MSADPHQLKDLADQAWARYQHWMRRLALLPREQFSLFDEASAQAREWRGIWHACELELIRAGERA